MPLLGLLAFWGSSLSYVSNASIPEYIWWGAGRWIGIDITNYTAIKSPSCTGIWVRTINDSPADSPRSPDFSRIVHSRNRDGFLHHRQRLRICSLYNPNDDGQHRLIFHSNTRFHQRSQHKDFLMSDPDHPANQ